MTRLQKHDGKTEKKGTELVPTIAARTALFPRWVERVEDLFADVWPAGWPMLRFPEELAPRIPPLDVYLEGGVVVVKAELPGMKKDEIEVHVTGTELTLSGRKEREEKVERKDYSRYERSAGMFTRTVRLPAEIDVEKIAATYKDGVLEVRAPTAGAAEPKGKKIEVA